MREMSRFQITMSLGPASAEPNVIGRLLQSADRFRLNGSHLSLGALQSWLERLRQIFQEEGRTIPLLLDLQGAKMRIGEYPQVEQTPLELELCLSAISKEPGVVPVPHPELFEALKPGELLYLNDARVQARVLEISKERALLKVERQGPLSSRKGINRPRHPIGRRQLLERDRQQIAICATSSLEFQFAYSFVHGGDEAALLRTYTDQPLIAKIERPEAISSLAEIDAAFDELWLCRGDMGAQAGIFALPAIQAQLQTLIPQLQHPVHLAGQVLEHMISAPEPTRSEVVHLYNLLKGGWGGIVLSDETAVGSQLEPLCLFLDQFRDFLEE